MSTSHATEEEDEEGRVSVAAFCLDQGRFLGGAIYSAQTCIVEAYQVKVVVGAEGTVRRGDEAMPLLNLEDTPPSLLWLRRYLEHHRPTVLLPDAGSDFLRDLCVLLRLSYYTLAAKTAFEPSRTMEHMERMYPARAAASGGLAQRFNLQHRSMLAAMSALLHYCAQAKSNIFDIVERAPHGVLYMEETTADWLQISRVEHHPSGHLGVGRSKDAVSLFSMMNHTLSAAGRSLLRQWFALPSCDVSEIQGRQEVVQILVQEPELHRDLRRLVHAVRPTGRIFTGMRQGRPTTISQYQTLVETARALQMIQARLTPHVVQSAFFFAVVHRIPHAALGRLHERITGTLLGFQRGDTAGRELTALAVARNGKTPTVRWGCNPDLDELRNANATLPHELGAAVECLRQSLPPALATLGLEGYHFPKEGYLLGVPTREIEALLPVVCPTPSTLDNGPTAAYGTLSTAAAAVVDQLGRSDCKWQFLFDCNGVAYFKTPLMEAFDRHVGDLWDRTDAIERRVRHDLEEALLQESQHFLPPIHAIAELDCLLSMAESAVRYGWACCPQILSTQNGVIHLEEAWHPVLQYALGNQKPIPFDFHLTSPDERLCLVGEPGPSGKSVAIAAVAHLQFLAQLGSFVPARAACLGLVSCILSCTAVGAEGPDSHFTAEAKLFAACLRHCEHQRACVREGHPPPLLLMDDWGRGTATVDAAALTDAALWYLSQWKASERPLFLCSVPLLDRYLPSTRAPRRAPPLPLEAVTLYRLPRTVVRATSATAGHPTCDAPTKLVPTFQLCRVVAPHEGEAAESPPPPLVETIPEGVESWTVAAFAASWAAQQELFSAS